MRKSTWVALIVQIFNCYCHMYVGVYAFRHMEHGVWLAPMVFITGFCGLIRLIFPRIRKAADKIIIDQAAELDELQKPPGGNCDQC